MAVIAVTLKDLLQYKGLPLAAAVVDRIDMAEKAMEYLRTRKSDIVDSVSFTLNPMGKRCLCMQSNSQK